MELENILLAQCISYRVVFAKETSCSAMESGAAPTDCQYIKKYAFSDSRKRLGRCKNDAGGKISDIAFISSHVPHWRNE